MYYESVYYQWKTPRKNDSEEEKEIEISKAKKEGVGMEYDTEDLFSVAAKSIHQSAEVLLEDNMDIQDIEFAYQNLMISANYLYNKRKEKRT